MADVAQLTVKVINTGLDKAKQGLDNLAGNAKKAESATEKLIRETKKSSNLMDKFKNSLGGAIGNIDILGRKTQKMSDTWVDANGRLRDAKGRFVALSKEADVLTVSLSKVKTLLTGTIAGLAVGKTLSVAREFDVLNAQLITATGSLENAKGAFSVLQDFAATTPYSLQQSVEGFTKLVNLGLTPSREALKSFGNTASAMGADLSQMIEAVADASTFEFERLKAFGIKAKQEKDKVAFTFQGVTTSVAKSAAEIEQYLMKIGNVNFAGAMVQRMNTLDGAISNLHDNINNLFLTIANNGVSNFLKDAIGVINRNFTELATIAGGVASIAMMKFATATFGAVNVVKVLGAVISKHPLMIMAGVIGGIVTAVFGLDNVIKELSTGFNVLGAIAGDIFRFIGTGFQGLGDLAYAFYVNNTSNAANSANQSTGFFGNFFSGVGTGFQGLLVGTARIFDAMGGGARGVAIFMGKKFGQLVVNVSNFFTRLGNKVFSVFEAISGYAAKVANFGVRQVNKIIKAANALPELLGFGKQITEIPIKFEGFSFKKGDISSAIDVSFSQSMAEGFKVQGMALENLAKSYFNTGKAAKKSSVDLSQFKKASGGAIQNANGLGKGGGKAAKGMKKAGRAAKKAGKSMERLSDKQKQAKQRAEALTNAFNSQASQLHKQIALFHDKSKIAELYYDLAFGKLQGLDSARAKELVDLTNKLSLMEKIKEQQEQAMSLRDKYDKIFSINNEYQKNIGKIATNPYLSQDDKSVFRAEEERKRQSALDDVRKPFTDINDRLNGVGSNPFEKLREQYETEKDIVLKYTKDNEIARQDALFKLRKEFQRKEALMAIGHGQSMASSLASITATMVGKQSKAYRVMFAVEKGFAIARSVIAIQTALASASASAPFPANLVAMATVAGQVASIVSNIQAVRQPATKGFMIGGFTGSGSNTDVKGVVHANEFVANSRVTDKYGTELRQMHNGTYDRRQKQSNQPPNITVINNGEPVKVDSVQMTENDVRIIISKEVPRLINDSNSKTSKALKNNIKAVRRLSA